MKFFLLIFIFILSCSSLTGEKSKKIYICGDHPCKNKKEVKSYFDNNISIEVYTVTSKKKKNQDYDLVQLNMSEEEKKKYISIAEKEDKIKNKVKKRKKLAKIDIKEERKIYKKKKDLKTMNKRKEKRTPTLTLVRLCKNLDECDIDTISKIITDMGKDKSFPDITAQ